jgi:DNA-binding LacI/PurR family transcriptional regulator
MVDNSAYATMPKDPSQLLLEHLRGDEEPRAVVLPTEFVARPSCAPPPGD